MFLLRLTFLKLPLEPHHYVRGYRLQTFNHVAIVTAVRTPWMNSYHPAARGVDSQDALCLLVVQSALKRAAIAPINFSDLHEQFQQQRVYLPYNKYFLMEEGNDFMNREAQILFKEKDRREGESSLQAVEDSLQDLEHGRRKTLILGEYNSINLKPSEGVLAPELEADKRRFLEARERHLLDGELVSVQSRIISKDESIRRRNLMRFINSDDLPFSRSEGLENGSESMEMSSALIFTHHKETSPKDIENAALEPYETEPLADLCALLIEHRTTENWSISRLQKAIDAVLSVRNLNWNDISIWLTNDGHHHHKGVSSLASTLIQQFGVNEKFINPFGITDIYQTDLEDKEGNRAWLLTHAVHHLDPNNYGCVLKHDYDGTLEIFLIHGRSLSGREQLPRLTLITKNQCTLCDNLVAQLEAEFNPKEFKLEKIYIDDEVHSLAALYEYDIPVLFVNGRFLCMHNLNASLLRRTLQSLSKNKQ